jgi:S-adenosylmethionine-dependent methyltransferase
MSSTRDWDAEATPDFVESYESLYGRVRTHVVDSHLRAHIPPPPASVIDVGGGAGHQSLPLARDGLAQSVALMVLAVELEASRRDPYRAFSRLFHLVGVSGA